MINPGIQKVVTLLQSEGFQTTDSGDGQTHDFACDREYGYVVIFVSDPSTLVSETLRVKRILEMNGVLVGTYVPDENGEPVVPEGYCVVQASYEPDGFAIIDVSHIHDNMLKLLN